MAIMHEHLVSYGLNDVKQLADVHDDFLCDYLHLESMGGHHRARHDVALRWLGLAMAHVWQACLSDEGEDVLV